MTIKQIKSLIEGKEYDFLRQNDHLKNKIILLTLGGSHAYGTNVETSDVDVRGCALNSPNDILGLSNFEQVVHTATDTTIYSFNKLVSLLLNCNPNIIEMLGCKPEHYLILTEEGRRLIENRRLFLSRRVVYSFGGYANQQLRRLENAIARDKLPQARREEHIRLSMENSLVSFGQKYGNYGGAGIALYLAESSRDDLDQEIFADIDLKKYPARQFSHMINDITNIIGVYEKLNKRNRKKDDAHLNKHAMHLVRLYHMCFDILEKEEVRTFREEDHDLLMDIRNGKYQNKDGTYCQEFFDMVSEYEKRLQYDKQNTSLPECPNMKEVEALVMSVNRRALDV